jgi:hypothetical protein
MSADQATVVFHVRQMPAALLRRLNIECATLGLTQAQVLTVILEAYWDSGP